MKIQVRRIEPSTTSEPEVWVGSLLPIPDNVWEDERESAEFEPRPLVARRWKLWVGLALALSLGGFGLLGRLAPSGTVPNRAGSAPTDLSAADLPFMISGPAAGSTVDGAVIVVSGEAYEGFGSVHLAVVVGGAVIGWATARVDQPGPWAVSIPIFKPQVSMQAELIVTPLAGDAVPPRTAAEMRTMAALRRPFTLRSGGPVGLWSATVQGSGATANVIVTGYAPVDIQRVSVRLIDRIGGLLAQSDASVSRDDSRPGATGGYVLGIGSFISHLGLGRTTGDAAARVEVDWHDALGGEWGTALIKVDPAPSAAPGP